MSSATDGMDEIVQEFLVESHENLDQLDRDFVELERAPESRELLASVFRTIHTIKGTSGFLGFGNLEKVTHVGENLLARLRDGDRTLDAATTDVLLLMVDAVRAVLAAIEETGVDAGCDVGEAVEAVKAVLDTPQDVAPQATGTVGQADEPVDDGRSSLGEILVDAGAVAPEVVGAALGIQVAGDSRHLGEILADAEVVSDEVLGKALEQQQKKRSAVDSSIRVDVDVLENLMQLVGELVLSRNQVLQLAADSSDPDLVRAAHRLDLISSSLQEGGHEDAHAAHGLPVGQAAPGRARPVRPVRQGGRPGHARPGDRARPDAARRGQGPAHPPGPQLRRPRHRDRRRPRGGRQGAPRHPDPAGVPRVRPGGHGDRRRRGRHRPRQDRPQGGREGPRHRRRARRHEPPRRARPHLPARASPPPRP